MNGRKFSLLVFDEMNLRVECAICNAPPGEECSCWETCKECSSVFEPGETCAVCALMGDGTGRDV